MEDAKPWWKSKTNWLHIGSAAIVGLEMHFHVLQPHMDQQVFAYWTLLVNLLGVMVRGVTTSPVKLK